MLPDIFNQNTYYYILPLAIYGLHGSLGSSKTWGAVFLAWLYQQAGYKIWSDIPLNPNYFSDYVNLDEPLQIGDTHYGTGWEYLQKCAITGEAFPYTNIYLLFDEFQYHSDSRMSRDMQNIVYSYLFIQSRKRGLIICMTSRDRGMIDNRDRDAEDITIKCYKKHNTPENPQTHKRKCYDHECILRHYFEWLIVDVPNKVGKTIIIEYPEPIFPMYQTTDLSAPVREIKSDEVKAIISALDKGGKV